MTTASFEDIGRQAWQLRQLGSNHPAPVLCVMARRAAGLTQFDLAFTMGTNRTRIAKIERGDLPMTEGLLSRWAEATGADESLLRSDLLPSEASAA